MKKALAFATPILALYSIGCGTQPQQPVRAQQVQQVSLDQEVRIAAELLGTPKGQLVVNNDVLLHQTQIPFHDYASGQYDVISNRDKTRSAYFTKEGMLIGPAQRHGDVITSTSTNSRGLVERMTYDDDHGTLVARWHDVHNSDGTITRRLGSHSTYLFTGSRLAPIENGCRSSSVEPHDFQGPLPKTTIKAPGLYFHETGQVLDADGDIIKREGIVYEATKRGVDTKFKSGAHAAFYVDKDDPLRIGAKPRPAPALMKETVSYRA